MINNFKTTKDIMKYFSDRIGGNVLAVGSNSFKYKNIFSNNTTYTVFDEINNNNNNTDVVGDLYNMSFENDKFDTIICADKLEHLEYPKKFVKELKRILKDEGLCLLTVPFLVSSHNQPNDYHRYTKEGLVSLFEKSEFIVIESGTYGRLFSTIFEIINIGIFHKKKFKGQDILLKYIQKIAFWLDKFTKSGSIYSNAYILVRNKNKV